MLCGYIASSADGFIAEPGGGVGFLDPFNGLDFGYDTFLQSIDGLVMGRTTYDHIIGFDINWPYPGKECHVITSTDLNTPPQGVTRWQGSCADYATAMTDRAIWVLGGAKLQAAFIAKGLLDRLDLFVMPVFLGQGIPLFPHDGPAVPLHLTDSQVYDKGVLRMRYSFKGDAPDV